ncbi:MAG: PhoH family protein, partial [Lachnospiraceae bacterium]|nr:PhoH family protein [Lachnospiraceae bacterium]
GKIEDIAFCKLTRKDVVRHRLVQKIVKAYEDFEKTYVRRQAKGKNGRERRRS